MPSLVKKIANTNPSALVKLREAMNVGSVPKNVTVYHYCSAESFFQIVKSKCIWLSDAEYTNDHTEIKWAETFLNGYVAEIHGNSDKAMLEKLQSQFQAYPPKTYMACFSENGDLLSQWRGYGDDGHGVAIGFNLDYFDLQRCAPGWAESTDITLGGRSVLYDTGELRSKIVSVVTEYLALENDVEEGTLEAAFFLRYLSQTSKNPAFSEEREFRIIHTPLILIDQDNSTEVMGGCSEMKYRVANKKLIGFFELSFSDAKRTNPINRVLLGPKCQISTQDIAQLLAMARLGKVEIANSTATYR